jgi:hypothetical protein
MNWTVSTSENGARGQRMLVPATMPAGIDPVALAQERERVFFWLFYGFKERIN